MSSISQILVSNTKWLLIVGILQKVIVFSMNQMVIAYSSPEVIGQISIQSELLLSTLLFLSREGIRIACLKFNTQLSVSNRQLLINLSWLPCFLVLVITSALSLIRFFSFRLSSTITYPTTELKNEDPATTQTAPSSNDWLYFCYCLAAFIECLGEPFYNYYQNQLYIQGRLQAETVALFVKSGITFIMIAVFQWTKIAFGIAQIVFAVVYVLVLLRHVRSFRNHLQSVRDILSPVPTARSSTDIITPGRKNNRKEETPPIDAAIFTIQPKDFIPKGIKDEFNELFYFDYDLCKSAIMIMTSSVFKHCLTEADKITLSFFCSHYEQGIYALTNNYGSLIARLLFLPIEDSMRISFSKIASNLRDEIRQHYYSLRRSSEELGSRSSNSLEAHLTLSSPSLEIPGSLDSTDTPEKRSVGAITKSSKYSLELANKQLSFIEKEKLKLSSLKIEVQEYFYYQELKQLFLQMNRIILYIGCIISLFGPYYIELLMSYLLKSQWQVTEVYQTLQYYCYYLLLLGMNGITEAFLQSIVDQDSSYWSMNAGLVISFIVFFVIFLYTMVYEHTGTSGIVIANCFGMIVRISWNTYLIYDIFEHPMKEFLKFRGFDDSSAPSPDRQLVRKTSEDIASSNKYPNPVSEIIPSFSWIVLVGIVKATLFANYFYFTHHTGRSFKDSLVYLGSGVVIGVITLIISFFLLPKESRGYLYEIIVGKRKITAAPPSALAATTSEGTLEKNQINGKIPPAELKRRKKGE